MTVSQERLLIIWYNTLCPVCRTGVDWQKRLLMPALQRGDVTFNDINNNPMVLSSFGVGLEDIRKRLHATNAEGELLVGVEVVIAVLRLSPAQRWLAVVLALPGLRMLASLAYDGFAEVLYAWNRRKGRW